LIAAYPGSFDPITNGHLDIIERSSKLYTEVLVLVAVNSSKRPAFSLEERVELAERVVRGRGLNNVKIESFTVGLLVDYVERSGAQVIIKGLRAVSDFEYEFQMALLNRNLKPSIETVFLATAAEYSMLSSSVVKEIARLGGDIETMVPPEILHDVKSRFAGDWVTAGAQMVEKPG